MTGFTILPVRSGSSRIGNKCKGSQCAATIQTAEQRQTSAVIYPQETFLMPSEDRVESIRITPRPKNR